MKATQAGTGAHQGLHIQLLGGFAVSIDGVRLPAAQWKSRWASNLVKLLALAPGQRLHREQVMDAFWPDSDLAAAANNFHQTLFAARQALASAGADCLVLEGGLLSLAGLAVDVDQFEAAFARAKGSQEPGAYQAALDLYPGDLLPEDPYAEWTQVRREALRQAHLQVLLKLALLQEQRREYAAGIELLSQVLAVDRAHEEAHAGLMRLYALSGQRQQALRQYQGLQEALRQEVEAEPAPELTRLYE